jgi:hypothetical protein
MPGINSADNRFGPSSFVVGTVLGNGCNYTSIQSAINDAFAAGGSSVLIRAGTYTENLTLAAGVDLLGVSGDGRPPNALVKINGNHTYSGNGFTLIQDIQFLAAAGDAFTIIAPPAGNSLVGIKFSRVDASAGRGFVVTGTGGGAAVIGISSLIGSSAEAFVLTDGSLQFDATDVTSNTSYALSLNGFCGVNASNGSTINGDTAAVLLNSATSNCVSQDCSFSSSNGPSFLFAAAGTVANTTTIHSSSGISGFYVEGTGNYQYAGDYFTGGNSSIDPLVTVTVYKWRPYATAGTTLTAFRGTSSFDSTQFTCVDGFVQLVAGPTGITWSEIGVNTLGTANSGYFGTAVLNLTLPASPVLGDTIKVKNGPGLVTVIANAGQFIKIGNNTSVVTGSAASSSDGDALDLSYQTSTATWTADSVIGNWLIT